VKNIAFLYPEFLLLIVPLLLVFFWRGRFGLVGSVARVIAMVLLTLILAVPLARLGGKGVDVVVVADLSQSMPNGTRNRQVEIIKLLEKQRGPGDRVGIVTYGREARIERAPEELGEFAAFTQDVDPDGSDLGGAIALAATLIPRERPGRIIVLSDGESNGRPTLAAADEAAARGLTVDFRAFNRGPAADAAVESLDLPGSVNEREPFQFSAWIRADHTVEAEAVLKRDGVEIARRTETFAPGATRLTFRDAVETPGVARYRIELGVPGDRIPENNVGDGAVRIEAPATILLVNNSGRPSNLSRALASSKLRVDTIKPGALPRDPAGLAAYRGVVLENVSASAVGPVSLSALTRFAVDLGGGVLLTGGGASFGVGGYFKSELDQYLPVSMEIKNEHRKLSFAMVVALDRSGSMAVPVGGGRTKMDLANLGTCAAIDTLGPYDEVGVIAVDSAPHVVSPLTTATEKDAICNVTRGIQSMGGGIFTYTALVSAANMVQQSEKGTRHIVLFADAADAEEPGDYIRLLARLESVGITVSVIGLGSESDSDAAFLKDVAERGHGRIQFTQNVDELPRLFAAETIAVARSSFISDPTPAHALPGMALLGEPPASRFPTIDGYNLAYLRPGATMGVVTEDDYQAPVLSFWHRGLGRIAALTAEVDGKYSGSLNAWNGFGGFSAGIGRWLLGGEPPEGIRASVRREGGQGIVRVELDPSRKRGGTDDVRSATAAIVPPGDSSRSPTRKLTLTWTGEDTLEARFPLDKAGIYLGAVEVGAGDNRVLPLSPLSLPYSPEFDPKADPEEGVKTLQEIARVTGGQERAAWDNIFNPSLLSNREIRDLIMLLALALLLLHIAEIAGRRLHAFAFADSRLRAIQWRLPRRQPRPAGPATAPATAPSSATATDIPKSTPSPVVAAPAPEPAISALSRAKAKARGRMRE
jgi:Mg-chelatase subunit ChlD